MKLELYDKESQVVKKALDKYMDSIGESHNPQDITEFLTLGQVVARMSPQASVSNETDEEDVSWML